MSLLHPFCVFIGLLHCSRVKLVWQKFIPLLTLVLRHNFVVNILFIFFYCWPTSTPKQTRVTRYLIKTILHGIWVFRNKATFHNGRENHLAIIRYVTADIKRRIHLDFLRLSEMQFSNCWLISDFCAIDNGVLIVNI